MSSFGNEFFKSRDRRHGDPFPLPVPAHDSAEYRKNPIQQRVFEAFSSLNALAGSFMAKAHESPRRGPLRPTSVQQWMMADIRDRISQHGEPPPSMCPESALRELLATSGPYSGDAGPLASFRMDKVKILSRRLQPREASTLCPPEAAALYKHFSTCVELK
jgi:hypothetical protein